MSSSCSSSAIFKSFISTLVSCPLVVGCSRTICNNNMSADILLLHIVREQPTTNGHDTKVDIKDLKIADDEQEDDIVDPWSVASKSTKGVDYDKLIS